MKLGVKDYISEVLKFYLDNPEQYFPTPNINEIINKYSLNSINGRNNIQVIPVEYNINSLYIFVPFIRPIGKPNNYIIKNKGFYKNNTISKYEKHLYKLITFNFNILNILNKLCPGKFTPNFLLLENYKQYIPISIEAIFNFTDKKIRDIDNLFKTLLDVLQLYFPIKFDISTNSINDFGICKFCSELNDIDDINDIINDIVNNLVRNKSNVNVISRDKFMSIKIYKTNGRIDGIEKLNISLREEVGKGIQIIRNDSYLGYINGIKTIRYEGWAGRFGQIGKIKLDLDKKNYSEYYYPFLMVRITYILSQ